MAVPFNQIPSGIRTPFIFIETDNTLARSGDAPKQSLLVAQKLAAGTVAQSIITEITGRNADAEFGVGSQLARMVRAYRDNDPTGVLQCIAIDDSGSKAAGDVTFTGPATADGTIYLYIAGILVKTIVTDGDTATEIGDALVLALTAETQQPVTGINTTGVVALTAKNGGTLGNDIDLRFNHLGAIGGEVTPAGVTAVVTTPMAAGATDPTMVATIAAMAGEGFDYVGQPYTDTVNLDAWETEFNFVAGRWSPLNKLHGHVWSFLRGTLSALGTAGNLRNDPNMTMFGVEADALTPIYEATAMATAQCAKALREGPARPTQTLELIGFRGPSKENRFTPTERDTLLNDGIGTITHKRGKTRIERSITTYQFDPASNPDDSYLDVTTMATLQEIEERTDSTIRTKYPRHSLVDDETRLNDDVAAVTPKIIKGELIALYQNLEGEGLVENADLFIENLAVTRPIGSPNRLDVLFAPDLANQFRIMAVLNQFRLQYADAA